MAWSRCGRASRSGHRLERPLDGRRRRRIAEELAMAVELVTVLFNLLAAVVQLLEA